jgi:transcriptional regulator with XRE-family HTH domain
MNVGERIKELRSKKGWTQTDLANQVGITYVQVGRYEKQKAKPSSQVLQKIATALDTTIDFLMNGSSTEQAIDTINDKELLVLFSEIENLSDQDKEMIKFFLDAVITKRKLQSIT